VLFEMLTGRTAFGGETLSDIIAHVLERDPDWDALPPTLPPRVRDLLRRCLHKNASRRLRDIGDARIEIEEVSTAAAVPPADAATGVPLTTRAIVRSRLFRAVAAGAFAMIAILAAFLVVQSNRDSSQPTFRPLTFRHGSPRGARLAADGRTVV